MNSQTKKVGRIVKGIAGFYYVVIDNITYECRARGKFRKEGIKPLIGDLVTLDATNSMIDEIMERRNQMVRPTIANIDQLIIVVSANKPSPDWLLVDKLIIAARSVGINVNIAINKCDNGLTKEIEELKAVYEQASCDVWCISVHNKINLNLLKESLPKGMTALAGQSGVGKSSLINWLLQDNSMETGELSEKLGRGKNTTRHVEMLPADEGCYIIDTPGFSMFDATVKSEDLAQYYYEFKPFVSQCWYMPCTHVHEPDCGVRQAIERSELDLARYQRYQDIMKQLQEGEERQWGK